MVKDVLSCMLITKEKNAENLLGRPMSTSKIDDDYRQNQKCSSWDSSLEENVAKLYTIVD